MYFVFVIQTRHKSVCHDNGKTTQKELSKYFSCDYLNTHYRLVKGIQNVNFKEVDTEPSTGKNDGF